MIYLDNASTTPLSGVVFDVMQPYLTEQYGNPGSLHSLGRSAKTAVEEARKQVASFLGAKPEQIIFTSGATEANNMVFEITRRALERTGKTHVITSQIEHKSVLKSVQRLVEEHGFTADYVGVSQNFSPHPVGLEESISPNTGLVSIMYANNEIGFAFDVRSVGKLCNEHGVLFHTDCVQAAGCRPLSVEEIGCDFATISAHKIDGPKGVGALFIKEPERWKPMILGGDDQEFGMRGGTENVPAIVGFGAACTLAAHDLPANAEHLEELKSLFVRKFSNTLAFLGTNIQPQYVPTHPATKTMSVCLPGVDAESLILLADNTGVCISAGSACNTREHKPSHVLTAVGLTPEQARSSFRVSFSRKNTNEDVEEAAAKLALCASILWRNGLKYGKEN